MFLAEIQQPVSRLKGAGPRTAELLSHLGIRTMADLLRHYPRDWDDRQTVQPLARAVPEGRAATLARITGHQWIGRPRGPRGRGGGGPTLKVLVEDETGKGALLCFGRNFLADKLPVGSSILLTGYFQYRYQELQSSSFVFESIQREPADPPLPEILPRTREFGRILPVYPLTQGLTQGGLRRLMEQALREYAPTLTEELPASLIESKGFLSQTQALHALHFPRDPAQREEARRRIIYQELFHLELVIARRAYRERNHPQPARTLPRSLQERLRGELPFSLTKDQERAVEEITADMERPRPMNRLLQGDVGCGKTLAAFLCALPVIEAGGQAALMAPTELLARQHADTAARLLAPLGVRVALFSGQVSGDPRRLLLQQLAAGEIDLIIGTHALFSKETGYRRLELIIVDEQHRFGVAQRKALAAKGVEPDLLMMTATPIPRSLALTAYGNLDVSVIRSMPPGRKPVKTRVVPPGKAEDMYGFIRREMAAGHQAYLVYPLISDSPPGGDPGSPGADSPPAKSLKNAEAMYRRLSGEIFSEYRGGLIHSRLPEEEKRETMEAFAAGEKDYLVATSVVEVGVDVANTAVMVVEHAERFGLSALHQLRGRVGRGSAESWCFLVPGAEITEDGQKRLEVMQRRSSGFELAEEDLRIRGPGELTGVRQSGYLRLRLAHLVRDLPVLQEARQDAFALTAADPGLLAPENAPLRELLNRAPPFQEDLLSGG